MTPLALLTAWVARQADAQGNAWLGERRAALRARPDARMLAIALGLAPRKVGKAALDLSADDLAMAEQVRPGWLPQGLSLDQAARLTLLLEASVADDFPALLKRVLTTSDLAEQIALYRGLPLYPEPARLTLLAVEGLRSAVRGVFESVAHDNPFPAEHFSQEAWNQMVLKALFIGAALAPIVGLDRRWNADLAHMLLDYAAERAAAGRPISPELWRGIGRFADAAHIERLAGLLDSGDALERQAAALALNDAGPSGQARLRADQPEYARMIAANEIGWNAIGNRIKIS